MTKIKREIDQEFLEFLEYRICMYYQKLHPKQKTKHWCLNVSMCETPNNYSREYVQENKQVSLKASVDKYGLSEYDVHLDFGFQSLTLYSKGLDIKKCIPSNNDPDLFSIDFENKKISIILA